MVKTSRRYAKAPGVATVNIFGIGTGTFTDSMYVYDNEGLSEVLFSDGTSDLEVIGVPAATFASYKLATPIGPTAGSGNLLGNYGTEYPTTIGDLSFTAVQSASFSATLNPVPEPATAGLLLPAVGTALVRRRAAKRRPA